MEEKVSKVIFHPFLIRKLNVFDKKYSGFSFLGNDLGQRLPGMVMCPENRGNILPNRQHILAILSETFTS